MEKLFLVLGALLGGLAVALGAFGAHGLQGRLTPDLLQVYETGVRYHFYHALDLFAVAVAMGRWPHLACRGRLALCGGDPDLLGESLCIGPLRCALVGGHHTPGRGGLHCRLDLPGVGRLAGVGWPYAGLVRSVLRIDLARWRQAGVFRWEGARVRSARGRPKKSATSWARRGIAPETWRGRGWKGSTRMWRLPAFRS